MTVVKSYISLEYDINMHENEIVIIEEKKFVVYVHVFPNGKMYVGITSQDPEERWSNGRGYKGQKVINKAIQKYGWDNIEHKILKTNLTEREAFDEEIRLIKEWKLTDRNYGYNVTNGGDDYTATSIPVICLNFLTVFKSIRQAADYYGVSAKCISDLLVRNHGSNRHYSGILSDGTHLIWDFYDENRSYERKEYIPHVHKIICVSTLEVFDSYADIQRKTGYMWSAIRKVVIGEQRYAYTDKNGNGLLWEMYDPNKTYTKKVYPKDQIIEEDRKTSIRNSKRTPIICLNSLTIYESIVEASEQTGIHRSILQHACNGRMFHAGFDPITQEPLAWEYYDPNKVYTKQKAHTLARRIKCLETGEVFKNTNTASKQLGISYMKIYHSCESGGKYFADDYHFVFLDPSVKRTNK